MVHWCCCSDGHWISRISVTSMDDGLTKVASEGRDTREPTMSCRATVGQHNHQNCQPFMLPHVPGADNNIWDDLTRRPETGRQTLSAPDTHKPTSNTDICRVVFRVGSWRPSCRTQANTNIILQIFSLSSIRPVHNAHISSSNILISTSDIYG